MLIDTHSHLNFNAFKEDSDEIIKECLDNGIWMINVGSQYSTSRRALRIAQKYEKGVYASIGLHPLHLESKLIKIKEDLNEFEFETSGEKFDYERYKELARSEKVIAIGEIGLDYYDKGADCKTKDAKDKDEMQKLQKRTLLNQLELAKELNLPIIFHCRKAHQDLIKILKEQIANCELQAMDYRPRGVIHCFTGKWQEAEQYLKMGFYIGINAIIFKLNLDKIIKKIPLEKILAETDCPYLSPPNFQNQERNNPMSLKYIIQKIAKIKDVEYKKTANIVFQNAIDLFKIK